MLPMTDRFLHVTRAGLAAVGLTVLVACGGGSKNVRPVSPPPATVPPSTDPIVETPDPDFSKHILLTNTEAAHDAGFTGKGVKIGVVDSGVNRDHPALQDRVIANLVYVGSNNDLSVDDVVGHGTMVSQIAAGQPFGAWPGGIAPDALIISARIISDEPPVDDGSGQGNEVHGALGLEPIHQDLINRGARIMNNSWGGLYWTDPGVTAEIADEYRDFIFANDGLVVFATGNESFDDPSNTAAMPSQPGPNGTLPAADLERGWLTVAALDSDNPTQLASYSNACGEAMNYCLTAPGDVVVTGTDDAPDNPEYWGVSGTSFAAPIVSGAAAVVWEAFPYFNNDLVRQTLLGTAKDMGAPGVDAEFGYGLLDVGKAVKGPAQLNWGQVVADFDTITSTWANDISGAGGITKRGDGQLDLSGTNTYTGETVVEAGLLTSLHDLPGDARVRQNGMLFFDNISLAGSLNNEGVVAFYGGDATGAEHVIGGDFAQTASGTFALDVGSHVQVQGRADIDGEVMVTGLTEGYVYSAQEIFLDAAGGVFGTFDVLSAADNVFLDATLGYDVDSVWLDITRLDIAATAQAMGFQPMALGSATRVEAAFDELDRAREDRDGPPVVDAQFAAAAGAFQRINNVVAAERSLDSLSGELHQAGTALSLMAIENNRHALESRFDRLQGATKAGAWFESLDGQRGASQHMDFNTQGWVIGQDFRLANGATVGAAFSESRGYGRNDARADSEHSRQVEGELYGAWEMGDSYLLGRFALGRSERDLERQVLLGAQAFDVDSRYAQRYSTASLQFGHRLRSGNSVLTPYIGAQTLQLQRDGFSEQGAAGFGLSTRDSTLTASQAIAGLRFDRQWSAGSTQWTLQGRAEYQQTLSQSGEDIDARFTAIDAWSPISGGALGDEVGVFGLGLEAAFIGGSRLGFDVDSRHADGHDYMQAMANWSLAF